MDFRFQQPETNVEAVAHKVTARLEGQRSTVYIKENSHYPGYFQMVSELSSNYAIGSATLHPDEAFNTAREYVCRQVKSLVLQAAARKVANGEPV